MTLVGKNLTFELITSRRALLTLWFDTRRSWKKLTMEGTEKKTSSSAFLSFLILLEKKLQLCFW